VVHSMKAAARPVVNASTAGLGAPVASTAEDFFSVTMSFVAIIFPFLIIFFLVFLGWVFYLVRKRRRRKQAERAERADVGVKRAT
jgi:cbb3-type cytochrome oxidase subunit 3